MVGSIYSPNWQVFYHLYTTYSPCLLGGEKCYLPPFTGTWKIHWLLVGVRFFIQRCVATWGPLLPTRPKRCGVLVATIFPQGVNRFHETPQWLDETLTPPPFVCLSSGGVSGYGSHLKSVWRWGKKSSFSSSHGCIFVHRFYSQANSGPKFRSPRFDVFFSLQIFVVFFHNKTTEKTGIILFGVTRQPNKANLNYTPSKINILNPKIGAL